MPHCALIRNKLKSNTIISLLKQVSSFNVPKLSRWTFYFLRCKMPFISSFIFFPVSSFVFLLLPSLTSFHIGFRQQQDLWVLCAPLIHHVKSNTPFYLHASCMTLLLCSSGSLMPTKSRQKFLIWLHTSRQTFSHSIWTLKFCYNQDCLFLFIIYILIL